jgi:hypothetical protein
MALGDGIRRNIATVSPTERERFRKALEQLNQRSFPGSRTDFPAGDVSHWFKQDEIHQATHVHGSPAFLPWHRELVNRFEAMLRAVDPDLSLHYWDWNTDPGSLFTADFMGNASGDAGEPWLSAGFYDPTPAGDNFRDDSIHPLNQPTPTPSTWSYQLHANPADPPQNLTRNKQAGAPRVGQSTGSLFWPTDAQLVNAATFQAFNNLMQGCEMGTSNNCAHGLAHGYIGGNLNDPHISFRDPFVFLLHSNVDRLWAMWQTQPGHPERLDPNQVYGSDGTNPSINDPLQPWAGTSNWPVRPWYTPENQQVVRNCKHPSVVRPPCYDTLATFPPSVTLETPTVTFNDVPEGETTVRAIVFSAIACADVHLSITAGPTVVSGPPATNFGTILGTSETIQPKGGITPPKGRLWVSYTGTTDGDQATGTVTVHCTETNQDFVVPITARTIARPTVAVCLALDQSNSMNDPAGSLGATRIQVLREAASRFVEIVQPNNGVGMVRFDHDAYPGIAVTQIGAGGMFDPNRVAVLGAVQAHTPNPNGWTSIGDGVALARTTLNPVTGYKHKAIIVFTDGIENRELHIADVAASIDNRTFAIGLGSETQVSTAALTALTKGTGGYLLLTGQLAASIDDYFRLTKYFLQILAGVTNNSIVVDPNGFIAPGMEIRLPFVLNEADIDCTAILLTDLPVLQLRIESPDGDVMDPAIAGGLGQTFVVGTNMSYYRFTLPLALGSGAHAGIWHAVLTVDEQDFKRKLSQLADIDPEAHQRASAHGVRYSFAAQTYSNLKMEAGLSQNSLQPGATLTVRAKLTEYDLPVERRAAVDAELQRPDNTNAVISLAEIEPGVFESTTLAAVQGIYQFRVMASGVTLRDTRFTREQTLTAAVFRDGDNPPPTSGTDPRTRDEQLCRLLDCLVNNESVRRYLSEHGLDGELLAKCVRQFCEERLAEIPEGVTEQPMPPVRSRELSVMLEDPRLGQLATLIMDILRQAKT